MAWALKARIFGARKVRRPAMEVSSRLQTLADSMDAAGSRDPSVMDTTEKFHANPGFKSRLMILPQLHRTATRSLCGQLIAG